MDSLIRDGIEKTYCVVRVTVGVEGRVEAASVVSSSGYAVLDSVTVQAALQNVYDPVMENGRPVPCQSDQRYTFATRR